MHPLEKYIARRYLRKSSEQFLATHPQIACYAYDLISQDVFLDGLFEHEYLQTLAQKVFPFCKSLGVCLDVGANIGNHSIFFSKYFSEVHAFEPNPKALRLLTLNGSDHRNIYIHPFGLSDSHAELSISEIEGNLGASRLHNSSVGESLKGEVYSLDSRSLFQPDCRVDFIKIDVEGHELPVVLGASDLIKRDGPIIVIEVLNKLDFKPQPDVISALRGLGYDNFYEFVPQGMLANFSRPIWKLVKVAFGLFLGRWINLQADLKPVHNFAKRNYPMIVCSSFPVGRRSQAVLTT